MLQDRSMCKVADNSGANLVMLFAVNGKNNKKSAKIGTVVVGSVKKASPSGKVKKGQVVYGVIVRVRAKVNRKDGTSIKFSDNAIVIINKANNEPIATRVFGPVARELRDKGFNKIVSLAEEVL
ncbi:50S ribosomal protein L14 [Candidatus Gracilibacteria bacterium]|nr:50S ribosomal protein L14 [Candidatus Gracilibacteria bacterium]NJS41561.1 50S ribosomal protein L14 [Candidatus Gracilibacteria bacterium]